MDQEERSRRRSRRDHGCVEERSKRRRGEITTRDHRGVEERSRRRRGEITEASREITEASRREITEASRKYHGGVERDHDGRAPSILDFVERENTKAESSREHKRRFGFLSERERDVEKPWCNTCLIRCASSEAKLSAVGETFLILIDSPKDDETETATWDSFRASTEPDKLLIVV
ncbi:hypothetical protein YC2023_043315 [Brassica napus]